MKVYVVLHSFLWDNPAQVVGVFTSKEKAIEALIDDVHSLERLDEDEDEDEPVIVTSREVILHDLQRKYKEYFCLGEDVWTMKESDLLLP